MPDPATGELLVDPDIKLIAQKFNLSIDFYYSSHNTDNAEYGRSRSASVAAKVLSSTSGGPVTIQRGEFIAFPYTGIGASGGIIAYAAQTGVAALSTLSFDGTAFTEYLNDGTQLVYQNQVAGGDPVVHSLIRVQVTSGNRHSYSYGTSGEVRYGSVSIGLLMAIHAPAGNLVTFLCASGPPDIRALRLVSTFSLQTFPIIW